MLNLLPMILFVSLSFGCLLFDHLFHITVIFTILSIEIYSYRKSCQSGFFFIIDNLEKFHLNSVD